ncbi:multidrug ABC transporter ATPase [Rothia sp. HMSC066H02]|uniref:multidrug ABC transporter ATPase n=1 Tax=unclassified Rothia (in: high G+C Gram-positive bacteria) TaxID=2689056 RepID=UPI0008A19579|nr:MULTISPECIES: multidrug ABC transporter ATPase [unclassified Rothia (in: high G+C Gram-positive bacteria)]OFO95548.1 multidrug ABC transporter ATPase [Rothia sp. HMSC065D09]OFP14840.1 multidrug ABC transporter ATPase [Rothia sp. HMSC066H02]
MLSVDNIWAKGRHTPLFDRTTFSVGEGEVIIVQADSQLERTSLALALTGRLPLSGGTISWSEGDDEPRRISMKRLRALSSVVDSPDVTAPEQHMRVHDYVSEMLSYNLPIFGRSRASRWLAERGLEELDGLWMDEISGEMNIELMAALAQHSPSDLLVFDTPSRHLNHTYMWLPYLEELAADEDHPRTVVAVVPHISESWHGARAVVGSVHMDQDGEFELAEESVEEQPETEELTEIEALIDVIEVREVEEIPLTSSTPLTLAASGTSGAVQTAESKTDNQKTGNQKTVAQKTAEKE